MFTFSSIRPKTYQWHILPYLFFSMFSIISNNWYELIFVEIILVALKWWEDKKIALWKNISCFGFLNSHLNWPLWAQCFTVSKYLANDELVDQFEIKIGYKYDGVYSF